MLGFSTRQAAMAAAIVGVGVGIAVAAALGASEIAVAGVALLLTGVAVQLLDTRRRLGDAAKRMRHIVVVQRRAERFVAALATLQPESKPIRALGQSVVSLEARLKELERAQHTVIGGLAAERVAAAERHIETADTLGQQMKILAGIDDVVSQTGEGLADVQRKLETVRGATVDNQWRLRKLAFEPVREVDALLQAYQRIKPRAAMPEVGGWALTPSALLHLLDIFDERAPRVVVECGSGASTVWLGYAMEAAGIDGTIVSLEHDERFLQRTAGIVEEHGVGRFVGLRHAPLVETVVGDGTFQWYPEKSWHDVESVDLLLVDGPPQATGEKARFPAFPLLRDRLNPGCVIVMDDATRPDEQSAVDEWMALDSRLRRRDVGVDRLAVVTLG